MSILDKFDKASKADEAKKSAEEEKVNDKLEDKVSPKEPDKASDEKAEEPKSEEPKEAKQEVEKDLDDDTDAPANPKDFERDGKVGKDRKDDPNGGSFKILTQLQDDFKVGVCDLKKSLDENKTSISEMRDLVDSFSSQLTELRNLVSANMEVKKSEEPDATVEPEKAEPEDSVKEEPNDTVDGDEANTEEEPKEELPDKADAVPDDSDYKEDKDEDKKKEPEAVKETIGERFAHALGLKDDFADKLATEAATGKISSSDYTEKSELLHAVSHGYEMDESDINSFIDYVEK